MQVTRRGPCKSRGAGLWPQRRPNLQPLAGEKSSKIHSTKIVALKEKEIVIPIQAEEPRHKRAELASNLLRDYFRYLGNDVNFGAADGDSVALLPAMMSDEGPLGRLDWKCGS